MWDFSRSAIAPTLCGMWRQFHDRDAVVLRSGTTPNVFAGLSRLDRLMLSIAPLADPPPSSVEPEVGPEVQPFDLTALPADEPSDLSELPKSPEFIMGPKQIASLAFVGIL